MNNVNFFKINFIIKHKKKIIKFLFLFLITVAVNFSAFSQFKEIQLTSPADGEALTKNSVSFQWVPLNEQNITYKMTLAKLSQDSGMKIKNQLILEKAPEGYYDRETKIYTEKTNNNNFKIDDIEIFFNTKEPDEKSIPSPTGNLNQGMARMPIDMFAWQVEGIREGKVVARSNISIFLFNKLAPPPDLYIIKLISPESGAYVDPESVKLCWDGLEQKGITYKIEYIYQVNDTAQQNIQNPFFYMSSTREQKTLDSLIYTIDSSEVGFWENFDNSVLDIAVKSKAFKNRFLELSSKISQRAKAIGLKLIDTTYIPKDSCYYESIWKNFDATKSYHMERFLQAYQCLLSQVNTENELIEKMLSKRYLTETTWNKPVDYNIDYGIYKSFVNFVNYLVSGKAAPTDDEKDALQESYLISNNLNELNGELIALSSNCKDFGRISLDVNIKESLDYKNQLALLKDSIEIRKQRDMQQIDSDIGVAVGDALSQISMLKSCGSSLNDTIVYEFPPYNDNSLCSRIFYTFLGRYLNERLCYLKIKIFYVPKSNSATWLWTGPEKTKFTGCYPLLDVNDTIAVIEGNGSGGDICYPANSVEREHLKKILEEHPNGKWQIEVLKNGIPVVASEQRNIITNQIVPVPKEVITGKEKPQKQGYKCSMRLMMNREVVPPPPTRKTVSPDSLYEIALDGKCEGDCYTVENIIKIDLPGIYYGSIYLPSPSLLFFGTVLNYQFPFCGTYTIFGKQVNTIGTNNDKFIADVACKLTEKTENKENAVNNSTDCPTCACMVLFNKQGKIKSEIINNYLFLGKPGRAVIELESSCFKPCEQKREVEWQITEPDSRRFTKKGKNLYDLKYDFKKKGKYRICVTETTKCPGKYEKCWAFLVVNTGE